MKSLRWMLLFVMFAVLDAVNPLAALAHEPVESAEEAVHLARQSRPVCLTAVRRRGPDARGEQTARLASRPSALGQVAHRGPVERVPVRKVPRTVADSPAAPEDH